MRKILYRKDRKNRKVSGFGKVNGICLALVLALGMTGVPVFSAMAATPWAVENGSCVDASGNVVQGAVAKGISVSKYQNRASVNGIDWNAVKGDGVSFAMVRLGYLNDMDPNFAENMVNASGAGVKTGVFFYTQALNVETAKQEAEYVLSVIKDYPVSYPVAYDVESQYLLDNGVSSEQLTEQINVFCKIIADAGYTPMIYVNNEWLTTHMDITKIPYDVWYARYGTVNECQNRTIWQATDQGSVAGIEGAVTIELAFKDYAPQVAVADPAGVGSSAGGPGVVKPEN